ncbi:O-acetyltransferase OatA [Microbacterium terrae]|uniref:O-acetyltransferase OatA n=2 Tax=Microbacterium terrae TaxID=69369 RepID=A0A0M2H8K1_9MICO|nr:O-acetyltransferase OatA [Microbacterium terrae]
MRALALLAVFAFHTWEFAGHPDIPIVSEVVSQNIRPDFFVVLTGFFLYLPFARDAARHATFHAPSYLARRLRRIVLPYWAALVYAVLLPEVLVVVTRLAGQDASWQLVPTFWDLFTHFTFTHLFFEEYWSGVNGSLWTMSLEMQLYLLFPLVMIVAARWRLPGLFALIGLSTAFRIAVAAFVPENTQFMWSASGAGRLMEFVAGMLAAVLVFAIPRFAMRHTYLALLAMGVIGGYAIATLPALQHTVLPLRELGLSVMFAGFVVLVLTFPPLDRALALRPLGFVGYRAYSIFLIHQPTMWYFSEFLRKDAGVPQGIGMLAILWTVGFALTVLVGGLLFVTVERPCILWSRRAGTARERVLPTT